jgi:hypothetical protein
LISLVWQIKFFATFLKDTCKTDLTMLIIGTDVVTRRRRYFKEFFQIMFGRSCTRAFCRRCPRLSRTPRFKMTRSRRTTTTKMADRTRRRLEVSGTGGWLDIWKSFSSNFLLTNTHDYLYYQTYIWPYIWIYYGHFAITVSRRRTPRSPPTSCSPPCCRPTPNLVELGNSGNGPDIKWC